MGSPKGTVLSSWRGSPWKRNFQARFSCSPVNLVLGGGICYFRTKARRVACSLMASKDSNQFLLSSLPLFLPPSVLSSFSNFFQRKILLRPPCARCFHSCFISTNWPISQFLNQVPAACQAPCQARGTEANPTYLKTHSYCLVGGSAPRSCPSELARVADAHGGAPLAFAARGKKSRVATWLLALISLHPSFHCVKTNTVKCQDNRKPFPATIHPRYKAPSLSRCLSPCQRENPTEEETPISQCYLRPLFCQILLPFHVLLWDR